MRKVMTKIAMQLNEANVVWAFGGSLIFDNYNISNNPNDIDILVTTETLEKAILVLSDIGIGYLKDPKDIYKTTYFYEYIIDGVKVDLICEFKIENEKTYEYLFDESCIEFKKIIDGVTFNYCNLLDWLILYSLMERVSKVQMILRYIKSTDKDSISIMNRIKYFTPTEMISRFLKRIDVN